MIAMNTRITFATKIMLQSNSKTFFGPGVAELLEDIEETGSVRNASQKMGLSYSKAWIILNNASSGYGREIVISQKGGIGGGKAYLTEDGKKLLERYRAFEKESKEASEEIFRRYFDD